jgi:chorismate mutase
MKKLLARLNEVKKDYEKGLQTRPLLSDLNEAIRIIDNLNLETEILQFNLGMENHNKAETSILVHKCDSEVNADLEDERRLYEQLKEKFEPKENSKKIGELYVQLKPTQNEIDRLTKRLLLELSKRLEESNEIGECKWIRVSQYLPTENSKVELLVNNRYIINATYIYGSFFRDSDNVLISPIPYHWRYKK